MTRRSVSVFFIAAVGVFGCSGEDDDEIVTIRDAGPPPRDAGARDGGPRDVGPLPSPCDGASALEELGYGGGTIAGALVVFALESDRSPVAGARVEVVAGGMRAVAMTDAAGCAGFDVPSGPADVHVMKDGYLFASWLQVPAQNLTLPFNRIGTTTPVPTATVQGTVLGLDQTLTTTTATLARAAVVDAISLSVFRGAAQPTQPLRPGGRFAANVAIVGGDLDAPDYALTLYPDGASGVVALGGRLTNPTAGQTSFQATHYGFLPGLAFSPDETLTDQDVTLTHPVDDVVFDVSYQANPDLSTGFAYAFLFLPSETGSIFVASAETVSQRASFTMPALDGALAGSTYAGAIQLQNDPANPTRTLVLIDPGTTTPMLDFGQPGDAPGEPTVTGRRIQATVQEGHTTYVYVASATATEWIVVATNTPAGTFEVTLPEVPLPLIDPLIGRKGVTILQRSFDAFDGSQTFSTREHGGGLNVRRSAFASSTVTF